MAILVVAEHDNASVKDATHKTVTAASKMGGDVDILVAGKGIKDVMAQAAKIDGANPFQMFFRIKLPQIYSTVIVVWTTLVILVLLATCTIPPDLLIS